MQTTKPFVPSLKELVEVMMRRSMRAFFAYAKENNISMSQFGALGHIARGASGVSDIGDDLGISSAAASQMLERLVQQGLILRSEDPHDRRVKQIVLTEKGTELLHGSWQARQSWLEDLVVLLSPEEQAQITASLAILIDKISLLENQPELSR